MQLAGLGDEAGRAREDRGPPRALVPARDLPPEVDPPDHRAAAVRAVPELGERDPELGRPPERVDRGRRVPDRVPVQVLGGVVVVEHILLRAPRRDGEAERGATVVVAVDHDVRPVAVHVGRIPARELDRDRVRIVVEADPDVDRLIVIDDPRLRRARRRLARRGAQLHEIRRDRGRGPHGIVQPPIEHGRRVANRSRIDPARLTPPGGDVSDRSGPRRARRGAVDRRAVHRAQRPQRRHHHQHTCPHDHLEGIDRPSMRRP